MLSILAERPAAPATRHRAEPAVDRRRRIFLVEDHPVVSSSLSALLNHEGNLEVCGIAHDYSSAVEMIDALNPDLIISDIALKGRDGLALVKDIKARCPTRRVLILSMHDESIYACRALRSGAAGYVMKSETVEALMSAIHKVLDGEIYLSSPMERALLHRLFAQKTGAATLDPLESATDRELEVFLLIGQAKSTREIARELQLSVKTIETHRAHLKKKLNLKTGRDLLQFALARQRTESGVESLDFSEAVSQTCSSL